MAESSSGRRRSRRRRSSPSDKVESTYDTEPVFDEPRPAPPKTSTREEARESRDERAMRDIVGAGPSKLGVSKALRGRDLNRPTEADLAEAEHDLVIIHRNWQPPE